MSILLFQHFALLVLLVLPTQYPASADALQDEEWHFLIYSPLMLRPLSRNRPEFSVQCLS